MPGNAAARAAPSLSGAHPVMTSRLGDAALTDHLLAPVWRPRRGWWLLFGIAALGTVLFVGAASYTVVRGIGVWGNNIPVAWAFAIINFVWWIGIGHAGTFISAFLLLFRQSWRGSINRVAETMTIFAVMIAGLFPILHLGRPWFFYWLVPYPTRFGVWPQFKSALPWDLAAVATYLTVSVLFWYVGLLPDLATARDSAFSRRRRRIYGVLALGWRGSARQWHQHRTAYLLLAGLATPLVISVHSIVSFDFAIAQLPGWHSTIFPPYFVAGAIYSGVAMVSVLLIPIRRIFDLDDVITTRHLDNLAKLLLAMGWLMTYAYIVESFIGWYSGNLYERYAMLVERPLGPYAPLFWLMLAANVVTPQLFWSRRLRTSPVALFCGSIVIAIGMWLERFIIIVSSLNRDFLPSSWHIYRPTWVDLSILGGSAGCFLLLFLLFVRFVPFVSMSELRQLRHQLADRPRSP